MTGATRCTNLIAVKGTQCSYYKAELDDAADETCGGSRVYVTAEELNVVSITGVEQDFRIAAGVLAGLLGLTHAGLAYIHLLPMCRHAPPVPDVI